MTEDEAKTKWCPFVKTNVIPSDGFMGAALLISTGRTVLKADNDRVQVEDHCIGSGCMAWRWSFVENPGASPFTEPPRKRSDTEGHCGLAGKP